MILKSLISPKTTLIKNLISCLRTPIKVRTLNFQKVIFVTKPVRPSLFSKTPDQSRLHPNHLPKIWFS